MEDEIYDVIIVGAGPAGMTAALYLGRANKKVLLLEKNCIGGNIAKSPRVENIPGFKSISGVDFSANMFDQIQDLETVQFELCEVVRVYYKKNYIHCVLNTDEIKISKSLIIATGTYPRELNLPTKNIYYCVTCDGPFFKDQDVIVVGSGNTGATYALELATYCNKVYIADFGSTMMCEEKLKNLIKDTKNIIWLSNSKVQDVTLDEEQNLSQISLYNDSIKNEITINVKAIFAAIGMIPQTKVFDHIVSLNVNNFIDTNDSCDAGSLPGVFAAGDCRNRPVKQVVTAVRDGAVAALSCINYLNNKYF